MASSVPKQLGFATTEELIVDNFAGGGGASLGIEKAVGRPIDIAVNHDAEALAMHRANHPGTHHLCSDVFDVDPLKVTNGRPVGLAWFSPDCTHFSRAKGGKPKDKRIRGLAWVVVRWAAAVRPRLICLENVEEIASWGPLDGNGRPCKKRRGQTFQHWWAHLEKLGYQVEMRTLSAHEYGAPTIRKRLFVIARRDGMPIIWPEPTHGRKGRPYRTAAECIDWSVQCPSIFERRRPLAEATLARIARGVRKFVIEAEEPFLVPSEAAVATLIQTGYGERPGQAPRVPGIDKPLGTVVAGGCKHALVAAFLAKHFGGNESPGWPMDRAVSTVTAKDHHALVATHMVKLKGTARHGFAMNGPMHTVQAGGQHYGEVRSFLTKFYGRSSGQSVAEPAHAVTARAKLGIVNVCGSQYRIRDIGMRMLTPRELFRAQGFEDDYVIDPEYNGKPLTKTAQIRMCGNSVCPPLAEAIVRANYGYVQSKAA